jgi:hypothetical protein
VACLLRDIDPAITPDRALSILQKTGVRVSDCLSGLTFPRIDALAAVSALQAPEVKELAAAFDCRASELRATWNAADGADALSVRVWREGALVAEAALAGTATSYALVDPAAGEHKVCLTASHNGLQELCGCASAQVPVRPETGFIRADCNGSEVVDISDPIFTLVSLYRDRLTTPPCLRACDANADDLVDLSDAVFTLGALFRATAPPRPPYPGCGLGPLPGRLSCEQPTCHAEE